MLGTIPLAVIARQTRSAMLEVLGEDYVRTARAKGLSPRRVVGVHALRNALIPVVTTIGLQVGALLAGAILTETIFSWPGIGKWMVDSIFKRDYVVVQSGLLLIALIVMAVNLIVDVLYAVINPRIRVSVMMQSTEIAPAAAANTGPLRRASRVLALFLGEHAAPSSASFVFVLLVLVAIFAPLLAPHAPDDQYRDRVPAAPGLAGRRQAPNILLGTDAVGRDILSRLIYGARFSLFIGVVVVAIALVSGIVARPARRLFPRLGRRADHARHGHHPGLPVAAAGAGAGGRSSGLACSTPCWPSRWCCSRISPA